MIPITTKYASTTSDTEYPQLLADLFHALNQPLTTLGCCLAVSLQEPRTPERYCQDLRLALQQVESISWFTAAVRGLVDAATSGNPSPRASLDESLKETFTDLLPVAQAARVRLRLIPTSPCYVTIEDSRLRQALFHLDDFTLSSSPAGSEIKIDAMQDGGTAVLLVRRSGVNSKRKNSADSTNGDNPDLEHRLALEIVRCIVQNANGNFQIHQRYGNLSMEIRLPLAVQEPVLPLAASCRIPA